MGMHLSNVSHLSLSYGDNLLERFGFAFALALRFHSRVSCNLMFLSNSIVFQYVHFD